MIKKYKDFYPSWYIEKKNNEGLKKFKRYIMFILVIDLLLIPNLLKKTEIFNLETENKTNYQEINAKNELNFLLSHSINCFNLENKRLEFKINKEDFKNKLRDIESQININSVEEVLEEELYLIKGEFYDK